MAIVGKKHIWKEHILREEHIFSSDETHWATLVGFAGGDVLRGYLDIDAHNWLVKQEAWVPNSKHKHNSCLWRGHLSQYSSHGLSDARGRCGFQTCEQLTRNNMDFPWNVGIKTSPAKTPYLWIVPSHFSSLFSGGKITISPHQFVQKHRRRGDRHVAAVCQI